MDQATISRDLGDLCTVHKSKSAKTKTNPKGAGRPKGKKKSRQAPKPHPQRDEMVALSDSGLSDAQIAEKVGSSAHTVRGEVERENIARTVEPVITPNMLSMTAQQKLELAIKQHKEKLTAEWRIAISARVDELLANTIGPKLKKEQDQARWVMKSRKGIISLKTFNKIRRCLHSDYVYPLIADLEARARYDDAWHLFAALEKVLLNEKDSPTQFIDIPKDPDWEELKRQASAARKAKRAARKNEGIQPSS